MGCAQLKGGHRAYYRRALSLRVLCYPGLRKGSVVRASGGERFLFFSLFFFDQVLCCDGGL